MRRYSLCAAQLWIIRASSLSCGMMALPAPTPQPNHGDAAAACSNGGHSRSRPLKLPASLLSTLNSRTVGQVLRQHRQQWQQAGAGQHQQNAAPPWERAGAEKGEVRPVTAIA